MTTAPSGSCNAGLPNQQVRSTGTQYSCQSVTAGVGTWGPFAIGSAYTLPIATTSLLGGIKPDGTNCSVNGTTGVLTCVGSYTYTLPTATSSVLGGVMPDGTSILNSAGAISATAASVGALPLAGGALTGALTSTSTMYFNPNSSSTTSVTAGRGFVNSYNTSGTQIGLQGQVNFAGASANNTGTIIGVQGLVVPNVSGHTLTTAKAGDFQVSVYQPVTNAFTIYAEGEASAGATNGYGLYIADQSFATNHWGVYQAGATDINYFAGPITTNPARKGTFVCTAAGTITISNTNELITSDVIISLNTAGGTISTAPAMKTVTSGTGFTVLCGRQIPAPTTTTF